MDRNHIEKGIGILSTSKIILQKEDSIYLSSEFIKGSKLNDEQNPKTQILESAYLNIIADNNNIPREDTITTLCVLNIILEEYSIMDSSDMLDIFT